MEDETLEIKKEDNSDKKITKDMIISEIVEKYPYLAEYIMDYGVHCIGCGIADLETLEEGFSGHGISPEEIDQVLEELNKVIEEMETQDKTHKEYHNTGKDYNENIKKIRILSSAIIHDSQGRLLLQLRAKDPGRNTWVLFGGHVEPGESERDAVLREIKEELNYNIKKLTFFKNYYDGDAQEPIWVVEEPVKVEELTLSEGYDLKFFTIEELETINIGFNYREILMDYIKYVASHTEQKE